MSLMSLNMIHEVPINRLYSLPVMEDASERQQSTQLLHLGHTVVSGRRMKYITYHYENNL